MTLSALDPRAVITKWQSRSAVGTRHGRDKIEVGWGEGLRKVGLFGEGRQGMVGNAWWVGLGVGAGMLGEGRGCWKWDVGGHVRDKAGRLPSFADAWGQAVLSFCCFFPPPSLSLSGCSRFFQSFFFGCLMRGLALGTGRSFLILLTHPADSLSSLTTFWGPRVPGLDFAGAGRALMRGSLQLTCAAVLLAWQDLNTICSAGGKKTL